MSYLLKEVKTVKIFVDFPYLIKTSNLIASHYHHSDKTSNHNHGLKDISPNHSLEASLKPEYLRTQQWWIVGSGMCQGVFMEIWRKCKVKRKQFRLLECVWKFQSISCFNEHKAAAWIMNCWKTFLMQQFNWFINRNSVCFASMDAHQDAQKNCEAPSCNWIWSHKLTSYHVMCLYWWGECTLGPVTSI